MFFKIFYYKSKDITRILYCEILVFGTIYSSVPTLTLDVQTKAFYINFQITNTMIKSPVCVMCENWNKYLRASCDIYTVSTKQLLDYINYININIAVQYFI